MAAAFAGEPLLAHWTQTFMGAAADFVARFFPIFLLGALFGGVAGAAGAAVYTYVRISEAGRRVTAAEERARLSNAERDAARRHAARAERELAAMRSAFDVSDAAPAREAAGPLVPFVAFAERVAMQLDADVDAAYPARWIGKVALRTKDGRTFAARVDEPKGDPGNTLGRAEIEDKAQRLAAYRDGASRDEMARAIGRIRELTEQIEGVRADLERAEQGADLQRAAELLYGRLPDLQRQLADAEAAGGPEVGGALLLKEEVDEEDIAEIVSRWTGVGSSYPSAVTASVSSRCNPSVVKLGVVAALMNPSSHLCPSLRCRRCCPGLLITKSRRARRTRTFLAPREPS